MDAKTVFDLYDANGDKKLNSEELAAALRCLGMFPTNADMQQLTGGQGLFDLNAFQQIIQRETQHEQQIKRKQQVSEAFACFDRSDNGRVDASELIHLMSTYGDMLADHEVNTLWELQQEGYLDYRQILAD